MDSANWEQLKDLFSQAIDLPAEERTAFLENCDEDLRVQIINLIEAHERAGGFIAEPAMVEIGLTDDANIGRRIDDYEILEEIGRGGMGAVYLAKHSGESFTQTVALKLIKRGMDTAAVLKRFVMERQILANLEHPNIARLLDVGTTTDGLPYFVMEYIEGLPVTKFCDAQDFSVEERLKLFRQICTAVQYAHQNLVVHRDIKPSNILITNDGTPKLLDFGIAKLLNSEWSTDTAEATATMARLLTPEYASPEQLRGANITTASDVYSLGVVLYELLSGQRPFIIETESREEFIQAILTKEPIRPSSVVLSPSPVEQGETAELKKQRTKDDGQRTKSLKGDLDNIILKALRKEPERRYASAQEFSEDVRRHLEGLPVTATADTAFYRAAKFVKRHKAGVFAAVLIALTLLTATAVTGWQAYRAERERARAEQRFTQVRRLANTVLFDYHDGIEKLVGSTAIREKMVNDALEYLDNLSAESTDDSELQRELAAAYQKVADVQGSPYRANLGNSKGALESYQKALAIRERLHFDFPENDQFKLDLIQSYGAVGELMQVTGKLPESLENYRQAFAISDTLPETVESKRARGVLFRLNAKVLALDGKLPESLEHFRKSINILSELIAAYPNDAGFKRDLGLANVGYGDALVTAGDYKGALAVERAAYELLASLISPSDSQSRREANNAQARVANILGKTGDKKGALETGLKALATSEELLEADSSNSQARRDAAIQYYRVALAYSAVGEMKEAIANFRKAIELCEADIASNPLRSEMRGDLVAYLYWLGITLEKNNEPLKALESYKKVLEIQQSLADQDPTNALQRGNLAVSLNRVSDMSFKFGDKQEAYEGYKKALAIGEELVAADPENTNRNATLATTYRGLGEYFESLGENGKRAEDWKEAKNWYQKSLDVWTNLQQKNPLHADNASEPAELKQKIQKCEAALK